MAHGARKQQVAAELEALAAAKGRLVPKRVVDWARTHRKSALHACFEWNNSRAAEQYRLWQARELIVSVQVTYADGKRRQVYVSPIVSRPQGYRRLVDVMSDETLRAQFLAQALEDLQRVCDKYIDLTELAGVRAAVALVRVGRETAA
jgi:hypothetical protein